MDTKASTILISAIILIVLVGMGRSSHEYPRVGNYFTESAQIEHCDLLSKWDVVVLSRIMRDRSPEILSTLRTMNPDIEILTYYPVGAVWASYDTMDTAARLYGEKVEACDWYLYDNKGNRVGSSAGSWFVNFTTKCPEDEDGKTVDQWLAEYIADQILLGGPWDGLLLDIMFENPWWLNNTDWFQDPPAMLDINRDGIADDPDSTHAWWRAGIISFLDRLRQEVGQSYILVGNGKHCLSDYLNGGIREDFPYMHGDWEHNMLSDYGYLTLCDELLDYPMQCVMMLCFWRDDQNTSFEPRRTTLYERFLRYTLCSALLGDGYYFLQDGNDDLWWEPYYDVDLGTPTSDAYLDSIWNHMCSCYSPVWRRDFENAAVYCNPYDQYISFDAGWLSPQDGLIKTYGVPLSVDITILSRNNSARRFDQSDAFLAYKVMITNSSESAVFAGVWAGLSRDGTVLVSGSQMEYLVGAQDTTVEERVLRLPPGLSPGEYTLEVFVGGPDYVEVDRDTIAVSKIIDFEKEQIKDGGDFEDVSITVYPQPAVSGDGDLTVEVKSGSGSDRFCAIRVYDVTGKLISTASEDGLDQTFNLDVVLSREGGAPLAPGVYFLQVDFEDKVLSRKMVLLRRR